MALLNKDGKVLANVSQPLKVFTSQANFDDWVATLPLAGDVDKFGVVKTYVTPMQLIVSGNTIELGGPSKALDFETITSYIKDEIVFYGGTLYRAKANFVSGGSFVPSQWDPIATLPSVAKDFAATTFFYKNEIIFHSGAMYRAKADFTTGAAFNDSNWDLMTETKLVVENFATNTDYVQYEIVAYQGNVYRAKVSFTSTTAFDDADWENMSKTTHILDNFAATTDYAANEMVYQAGRLYRAKVAFTSGATFDIADWQEVSGDDEVWEYDLTTEYPKGSLVINGTDIYLTLKIVPAGTALTDTTSFKLISSLIVSMTQAEYDAATPKPFFAHITDSLFDAWS